MKLWRDIKRLFTFWIEISKPPKWISKATQKFYDRCSVRPYDKIIYFKGKNNLYKVWFETIEQGRTKWHYYRKKRIR